jgi:hypothetical protein
VEIGWLFHSTPGMNAETIQEEIFRHCGIKTALRWKIIATELIGTLPKTLQIRAYHVSVRREDMAAAEFVLTEKNLRKTSPFALYWGKSHAPDSHYEGRVTESQTKVFVLYRTSVIVFEQNCLYGNVGNY